eukprot:393475_1
MFALIILITVPLGSFAGSCNYGMVDNLPYQEGYCQNNQKFGNLYNGVLHCQYDKESPYAIFNFYNKTDCSGEIIGSIQVNDGISCCETCEIICGSYHVQTEYFLNGEQNCIASSDEQTMLTNLYLFPAVETTPCYVMVPPMISSLRSTKHYMKKNVFTQTFWDNTKCQNEPSYSVDYKPGCNYVPPFNITYRCDIETEF